MKRFFWLAPLIAALLALTSDTAKGNGYRAVAVVAGTPQGVATTALALRADQGIAFGGMATPYSAGTTPPTVTLTGTPSSTVQSFQMTCTLLGILGTSHVAISINGSSVYAGVSAASLGPYSGITVGIAAGAMAVDDVWTSVPVATSWTSTDASHTVFSQVTLANMPAWIAPGLVLTGWPASINGQTGLRFAGGQEMSSAFALAQPYTMAFVASSSLATVQGFAASGGGPYAFVNAASALEFSEGTSVFEQYAAANIKSPFVAGFIYAGAGSQFAGAAGPTTPFVSPALAGNLYLGSLGGVDFLIGDICEFWIDGEATPPLTWGQVRQGWVSRYGF